MPDRSPMVQVLIRQTKAQRKRLEALQKAFAKKGLSRSLSELTREGIELVLQRHAKDVK